MFIKYTWYSIRRWIQNTVWRQSGKKKKKTAGREHCASMPLPFDASFLCFFPLFFWRCCLDPLLGFLFLIDATHSTGTFVMLLLYDGVEWCHCWVLFLIDATHSTGTFVMPLPYDGVKSSALVVYAVLFFANVVFDADAYYHKGN